MTDWLRVSRGEPCPICKHPDWCLIDKERTAVICPRVESPKRCGEAGWLHRLTDAPREYSVTKRETERKARVKDMAGLASLYRGSVEGWRIHHHAAQLGVSANSLLALGVGWAKTHDAWSFPMHGGDGKVIGIRLRREDGSKFAVRGSKNGLFLPRNWNDTGKGVFVVEGPTDTAAMIHLGIENTIGRPFNRGGTHFILTLIKRLRIRNVCIIADADGPGMAGAIELSDALGPRICRDIIRPPNGHKDVRKFVQSGGDSNQMWRHIANEAEA